MDDFTLVGARPSAPQPAKKQPWYRGLPLGAMLVLAVIILGCLSCGLFLPRDPTYMDLANCNAAPSREFLFGTDAMGRDIFSMIWYGGRASLTAKKYSDSLLAESGSALLSAGVMPNSEQLAAMGLTQAQARLLLGR